MTPSLRTPVRISLGLALAVAAATVTLAASRAPSRFGGSFAAADVEWQAGADGGISPRLAQTRPLQEAGKPALPVRDLRLLVPAGLDVGGVEIVPLATRRLAIPGELALAAPLVSSEGVEVREDRLPLDGAAWPAAWGEFGGVQTRRGFRVAGVRVFPLRALRNDAGRWTELEVLERYEVRFLPAAPAARRPVTAERQRAVPGERARLERLLAGLVDNPEALAGYARQDGQLVPEPAGGFAPTATPSLSGSAVRYLIITSEELAPSFQPLAEHKTGTGFPAIVKTLEWILANYQHGADVQETVRMFLREAYERWGIEYVLLGGDTDVLPARYAYSTYYPAGESTNIPADIYFGCLDGDWNNDGDALFGEAYQNYTLPGDECDLAEEILVGRAPVSTPAAAANFVAKVIAYESQPTTAMFPSRMLFAAEVLFDPRWPEYPISLDGATFAEQIYNSYLTPCTDMTAARMYEATQYWPGSVPLTRAALIDSLDAGHYGIVNQIGHGFFFNMSVGDKNFMVSDADALTNGDHTFLLYALNCASAAFDYGCLMERFIQNDHGGSVASIGSARAAFPYTANEYQLNFFDGLMCGGEHRLGDLIALSRAPMLPDTYINTVDRWTFLNYTLLGDPALGIWTGAPRLATVAAPSTLAAGAQVVTVTVTSGGQPVPGAVVCLSKPGDDYAWGETNELGVAQLAYTPVSAGTATLRVSGQGLALRTQQISVTLAGAYIAADTVTIVDDGSGGTTGNGDGRLDAGETVAVWVGYRDNGSGGALGCSAALTGGASGLTILDGTAAIGNVPSGGQKQATEPFLVQADAGMTDGTLASFVIVVSASVGGPWTSEWQPTVLAPEVQPVAIVMADSPYGDGDGVQENGERVTLALTLKNYGGGLSGAITGRLRTADPTVTLRDTVATWADMGVLATSAGTPLFSLSESDVAGTHWCWVVFTDERGRSFRHDFQLEVPSTPSGLATDTTQGPDVIALAWTPLTTGGILGYHVYRSTSQSGPFTRANADVIVSSSYFRDDGLAPLTQYYYQVSAVDSSLSEGARSATIAQSTAPPELAGFPLPFAVETSSHPAVGDVNGDGVMDVVLGADEVYVWDAFGGELLDGDADAQTHGPLTDLEGQFGPAGITLASLDDLPGLEIVACNRNAYQVMVLRADGSILPGWPKTTGTSWNWTTPAVGDIDGDGGPEIALSTVDGRLYVWHADGTELRDGDSNPATNGVFISGANGPGNWSWSSPALCDLDGDGAKEIIFGTKWPGTSNNRLRAYRYNGVEAAGFPYTTTTGIIGCSPSVGDLDGDGQPEIVFVAENDSLHVVRHNGARYPGFPIAFTANSSNSAVPCPSPALADFNGDGRLEIVAVAVSGATNAAVRIVSANYAGGTSGQTLTGWPRSVPGNSESSPVVGDIDGDGGLDVLFGIGGGDEATPNNLYAWKADGTPIAGFPITLGGPVRPAPVICDLDADGLTNIVYGGWDLMMHVWSMPFAYDPARVPWGTFRRSSTLRDGVYHDPGTTGVTDPPPLPPVGAVLALAPSYPNPFNPQTTLRLYVPPVSGQPQLRLGIYDVQGRRVRTLHNGPVAAGWHAWTWDGCDDTGRGLSSGVYLLRAQSDGQVRTQKLALIK